jgi:hypothetical protein
VRSLLAQALACCAVFFAADSQGACTPDLPGGTRIDSPRYALAWRAQPEKISVGKYFALELALCPSAGAQQPESLSVDARMPEHRHGMNYKAELKPLGPGRWRAEGLMFHMPGRWELMFDLRANGVTDHLSSDLTIE